MAFVLFAIILCGFICAQAEQPSVKRCTGQKFDSHMCPLGTYIEIVGANYYTSSYPTPGFGCPAHSDDCIIDVTDDHPDYYDNIKRKCSGKVSCDELVAEQHDPVRCGDVMRPSSYVIIQYQCLPKKFFDDSDAVQQYNKKCPSGRHEVQCPDHNVIRIIDGFYGTSEGYHCDEHYIGDLDCRVNMMSDYPGKAYLSGIKMSCNGRQRCTVSSSPALTPVSVLCGQQAIFTKDRYELLVYECVPDTLGQRKCIGEFFDDIRCGEGSAIKTISAKYGDSYGDTQLRIEECKHSLLDNAWSHCQSEVADTNRQYAQEISSRCERKRQCNMLPSRPRHLKWCKGGGREYSNSEYVTIEYRCVTDYDKVWNPPAPIGEKGGAINWRHDGILIPILAGVAGFFLLLVIILIIVFCCRRRKRRSRAPKEENKTAVATENNAHPPTAELNNRHDNCRPETIALTELPPSQPTTPILRSEPVPIVHAVSVTPVRSVPLDPSPKPRSMPATPVFTVPVPAPRSTPTTSAPSAPTTPSTTIRAPYAQLEPEFYDKPRWNFMPRAKVPMRHDDAGSNRQYSPARPKSSPQPNRYDGSPGPRYAERYVGNDDPREVYSSPRRIRVRNDPDDSEMSDDMMMFQPALFV